MKASFALLKASGQQVQHVPRWKKLYTSSSWAFRFTPLGDDAVKEIGSERAERETNLFMCSTLKFLGVWAKARKRVAEDN